jgi:nitrous-oxide reductase
LLVKPKGWKPTKVSLKQGQAYTKADYDKQYKTNLETQAVIDQVVGWITSHNYKDFPDAAAMVDDATDQLNKATDFKAKMQEAVKKQDWQNATLWAGQWWQYQVKAADIGLRAKAYLEQHGAKSVK